MRLTLLLAASALAATFAAASASAQTPPPPQQEDIVVDQGVLRPTPIAVVNFSGQNGADLGGVIRADLRRSGYFEPLDPAGFVETGLTLANAPNFPQWTSIGAQAVL
ncbi:MAG: Tol-Pal system protein TolB, partial [Brevundimonas sp.]